MFPFGDVGIALYSGDGGVKSAGVNFGIWNSLNTGSSGLDASPKKRIHYEQDFYASLSLGVGGGVTLTPMFTTYTSPNGSVPHGQRDQLQGRACEQVRALRAGGVRAQRTGRRGIGRRDLCGIRCRAELAACRRQVTVRSLSR